MSNFAYALNGAGTSLIGFDPAETSRSFTLALCGITAGESLVGIDFRPMNGMLYGLGVNATAETLTLYAISIETGKATIVGSPSQGMVDGSGNPIDFPASSASWGFDFNPASDRVRVVTETGLNFRINPNNGALVDGSGAGGVNPDPALNGASTSANAVAHTNNTQVPGGITTAYVIDTQNDLLLTLSRPTMEP